MITLAKEVMFSTVSVCLFVRLLKTTDEIIFMKFHGMVGHNPQTSRFDSE